MDLGLPLYLTQYCSAWGQFKVIVNIEMFYDESSWNNCMLLKTNVCFLQFLFFFERISFHPLVFFFINNYIHSYGMTGQNPFFLILIDKL